MQLSENIEIDTKKSFWYSMVNQVECWSHVDQTKINYLILLRLKAPAADSTPAASCRSQKMKRPAAELRGILLIKNPENFSDHSAIKKTGFWPRIEWQKIYHFEIIMFIFSNLPNVW